MAEQRGSGGQDRKLRFFFAEDTHIFLSPFGATNACRTNERGHTIGSSSQGSALCGSGVGQSQAKQDADGCFFAKDIIVLCTPRHRIKLFWMKLTKNAVDKQLISVCSATQKTFFFLAADLWRPCFDKPFLFMK